MSSRSRGPAWRAAAAAACVALTLALWSGLARADQLDGHVQKLRSSEDYKVRLSAALALSKSTDVRAIDALAHALADDSEATIRNVAALALGKNVDSQTPEGTRDRAIAALEAGVKDDDAKVRGNASRSLEMLEALRAAAASRPLVFVNIDLPADLTKKAPSTASNEIRAAVRAAFDDNAPTYALDWKGGKLPTKSELDAGGTKGFYVGATVSLIEITKKSGRGEVKCSVSIRVNPWQGRDAKEKWESSKAASASGSGKAIGGVSDTAVATSIEDCVSAVAEQVTAKQIVPFIRKLASQ